MKRTEKVTTVRNGNKGGKEKNTYSGYVFVEAILVGEGIHHLRNTTNVIDFLGGKSNQPEPLRPSEVNRMLGAVDEMQEVIDSDGESAAALVETRYAALV